MQFHEPYPASKHQVLCSPYSCPEDSAMAVIPEDSLFESFSLQHKTTNMVQTTCIADQISEEHHAFAGESKFKYFFFGVLVSGLVKISPFSRSENKIIIMVMVTISCTLP
ncbi:hypothetical protein TNCT_31401 [Trichonephila clavata]|uniref:Uncharacterized protein n=1 Tax=Trichonephila clavata TaxID=2740835 RepID=A0A8X6HT72_TRICU|nr:hypothetical protein TNCT_31401 [Trichonephila clavata]